MRHLVFRADQINDRLVAGNERRVNRVGRKKIAIAGTQRVRFMSNSQLEFAAQNPVRLIFGVRVWAVLSPRRVAPLKDAVALGLQACAQLGGIWRIGLAPAFYLNAHSSEFNL